jgi:hypothetical protein
MNTFQSWIRNSFGVGVCKNGRVGFRIFENNEDGVGFIRVGVGDLISRFLGNYKVRIHRTW